MGEDSEWFKVRHRNFDVFAEEVIDDKIKVSVDLLLQEFECPVCFNLNDDAYITKCGHTFCGSCITKWIQQSQNCPHCKEPLLPTDTTKDRRSDQILSVLLNAKSQAATEYIKNLVHKGCQLDDLDVEDDLRNPIENIFSLNVQESLAKFREYFTDMKRNFRKMCKQSTSENEIKMIENAHQIQINALLETYDTYMKSMEPKIDLLPIWIQLKVVDISDFNWFVSFPRMTSIEQLKQQVIYNLVCNGEDIYNMYQLEWNLDGPDGRRNDITDSSMTLVNVLDGSILTLSGTVIVDELESDLKCFSKDFVPGKGMLCDYYACEKCRTDYIWKNWVETWHGDHRTWLVKKGVKPTWAECYWYIKAQCKLPNKNSRPQAAK